MTRLFCRPYSLEMPPLHETTLRFRKRIPGRLRHLARLLTHIIPQGQRSPQLPPDCITAKVKNQMRRSTPRSSELKAPADLTHKPSARRVEGQAVSGRSAYKETGKIIGRGLGVPAAAIATVLLSGCLNLTRSKVEYPETITTIEIACENPFSIRESEARRRIKVSSSAAISELGRSFWDCDNPAIGRLKKAERYHMAAREYLAGTGRKECKIIGTEVLGLSEYEFRYSCDELPSRSTGAAKKGP